MDRNVSAENEGQFLQDDDSSMTDPALVLGNDAKPASSAEVYKVDDNDDPDRPESMESATRRTTEKPAPPPPHVHFSTFSHSEKIIIVIMGACASFFSPLSANIYYPVFNTLAEEFNVSNTLINLTVTCYMVC